MIGDIRNNFPALQNEIRGKPIVYLDSACSTLLPRQVISAMNDFYESHPVCADRSVHSLGMSATEGFAKARETLGRFIGAKNPDEVIFTKNSTEGLNLAANGLCLKKGDSVLTTDKEHNSNFVPWMRLSEKGIKHIAVPTGADGEFGFDAFLAALDQNVKLVSVTQSSNIDGTQIPAKEIIKAARDNGSLVMLDGAQSAGHFPVDVKALGVDFFVFSSHKMCGPALGVLYCGGGAAEKLEPVVLGGGTVEDVNDSYALLPPPHKFEAGIQNCASAVGAAAAAKYLQEIGLEEIHGHCKELNLAIDEKIRQIEGAEIVGCKSAAKRGSITSFNVRDADAHQIAVALDEFDNVMVRSGMHCAHRWFNARKIPGCVRTSLHIYNTKDDVRVFGESLEKAARIFRSAGGVR